MVAETQIHSILLWYHPLATSLKIPLFLRLGSHSGERKSGDEVIENLLPHFKDITHKLHVLFTSNWLILATWPCSGTRETAR